MMKAMKDLLIIQQKVSLAACGLGLAMVLVSAGCSPTGDREAKKVKELEAKVADLEQRVSQLEKSAGTARPQPNALQQALQGKFSERSKQDRKKYTPEQLQDAENIYQAASKKWGTPESIEGLKQMAEKFPGANRTGCAVLYLAQSTTGPESEKYFKDCIHNYNDCYYGDGVQVGAFARFCLADYYNKTGDNDQAEALYKEIKDNYPGAIDHSGQLLVNLIK
jgi:outer membrane murein-binding lipoprotein Lpp